MKRPLQLVQYEKGGCLRDLADMAVVGDDHMSCKLR